MKMLILPNPTYRFNTIFVKISVSFFKEIEKNLNIPMEEKRFQVAIE